MWARQRGRRGGQDQTFPVACPTTIKDKEDSDTCKHETVSKLPRQRCVCVCALVAMHEYVHTAAACIGAEEEGVADIAGRRIQFPLSSIPVCLV